MGVVASLAVRITADVKDFSREIAKLDNLGSMGKAVGDIAGSFKSLEAIAGTLGIGKMVDEFLDLSSSLTDISSKTGISVKELQRLEYAGSLVGLSLDNVSSAASMLQKRIGSGNEGAASALKDLGLNFEQLRALDPGQQFTVVARELGKVTDQTQLAALATDLFGKTGTTLIPLFKSDLKELGDEAERFNLVLSNKTVKAADDLGDLFAKLKHAGMQLVAEGLKPILTVMDGISDPGELARWEKFKQALFVDKLVDGWNALADAISEATDVAQGGVLTPPGFAGHPAGSRDITLPGSGMTKERTKELTEANTELDRKLKEQAAATKRAAEAWQEFNDKISGREAIKAAQEWVKHLAQVGGLSKISADSQRTLNTVLGDALEAYSLLGQTAPKAMTDLWVATMQGLPATISGINNLTGELKKLEIAIQQPALASRNIFGAGTTVGLPPGLAETNKLLDNTAFRAAPDPGWLKLLNALQGQGPSWFANLTGQVKGLVDFLRSGDFKKLTATDKASALIGGALNVIGATSQGGTGSRVLGGALAGAQAGAAFGPWGAAIGAGVGGLTGLFRGLFGHGKGDDGDKQRDAFLKMEGGAAALAKQLHEVGASGDAMYMALMGAKNGKAAEDAINNITNALDKQKQAIDNAMSALPSGVNARSANITSQADFSVVGAEAIGTFAFLIQQGQSAIQAFQAITPAVDAMSAAFATGNFEMTGAAEQLMNLNAIVTANKVQFDNLSASGSILTAMLQANIKDGQLFAAVASDIGTQIQTVIDRGVPMQQVFALAQPQLQALWEAQNKWHFELDATTQSLLDQAAAQGFVGEAMKSVQQQILDVLIKIGEFMGALPAQAKAAADGMSAAFGGVHMPSPGDVNLPGKPWEGLPGEYSSRAEAIVPLGGGMTSTIIIEQDGRQTAEAVIPYLPGVAQRFGLA
jgi:hypothetical protein